MILQLNPPLPLDTPRGKGMAHFLIDYGPEADLLWVVFIDETGECWTYRNSEIRLQKNETMRPDVVAKSVGMRTGPMVPNAPTGVWGDMWQNLK